MQLELLHGICETCCYKVMPRLMAAQGQATAADLSYHSIAAISACGTISTPMRIQAMHGRLLRRCSFQALVMAPMKGGLQFCIMLHISPDDALDGLCHMIAGTSSRGP